MDCQINYSNEKRSNFNFRRCNVELSIIGMPYAIRFVAISFEELLCLRLRVICISLGGFTFTSILNHLSSSFFKNIYDLQHTIFNSGFILLVSTCLRRKQKDLIISTVKIVPPKVRRSCRILIPLRDTWIQRYSHSLKFTKFWQHFYFHSIVSFMAENVHVQDEIFLNMLIYLLISMVLHKLFCWRHVTDTEEYCR